MNEKWHATHPMRKNPTMDERVRWHLEHAKECACRPIPDGIRERSGDEAESPSFSLRTLTILTGEY